MYQNRVAALSTAVCSSAAPAAAVWSSFPRSLSLSAAVCIARAPRQKPRERPHIAGLQRVTYAERMHYVPGLAKPEFPPWEQGWRKPGYQRSPKPEQMELHKDQPCYIYNQRTNPLEGAYIYPHIYISYYIDVLHTQTNENPKIWYFCPSLLNSLLHLCGGLQVTHPSLGGRMLADKYSLAASWSRGEDLFQIRGQNGFLLNSMTPLPALAGQEEVRATADHVLETFYPISPTIDLQCTHVYDQKSSTGFREDYPYPHAHTLFLMEPGNRPKLFPEQLRAKMVMFTFGNALARAQALYGNEPRVLEKPIVVQSVATNGRIFQFVVFQLNTTALESDDGVKNMVWVDSDQPLYDYAKVRPLIKKKQVKVPAGLSGYHPDTFKKFLALYLHGAA
uniref:Large ribosomal subunit protein mL37 n=1 Tax=Astyanax mexicanus TaxID=7994 RepID=A0A8B9KX23_ASTMX